MAEQLANNPSSTLNGSINNSTTTVVVTDASSFPSTGDFRLLVESEIMKVTSRSSNTLTVTRGQEGSSAASHADLTPCYVVLTKEGLTAFRGDLVTAGAYASRPAASTAGLVYLATDGPVLSRDSGSAWQTYGPIYKLTDPTAQSFSWVNQGTSTVSTTKGGIVLVPQSNASLNYRLRVKTAPSTPYTITAAFKAMGTATGWQFGLFFRQSSDGKLHNIAMGTTTQMLLVGQKWDSPTGSVTSYFSHDSVIVGIHPSLAWFQISDDGSNRISRISPNGQDWIVMHSVSRTDYLTADQVGFGMFNQNTSSDTVLQLLSWEES